MNTKMMDMKNGPVPELVAEAGRILRQGGLVAFPTETVYGLGGNALDPEASEKIYAAKGRPSDNPLIVHIADLEDLAVIAQEVPETAVRLAREFWPGPLTMILKKAGQVPKQTTGGLDTVAVRMPDHPVALALIRAGGGFIAGPSANVSGRPSPTSAAHVWEDLHGRIDAIADGGEGRIGIESTIIDLTADPPVILRPGYISRDMLQQVIGKVEMDPGLSGNDPDVRPKAPGMKYRHYAPKADMKLVEGEMSRVTAAVCRLAGQALAEHKKVGIIASEETMPVYMQFLRSLPAAGEEGNRIVLRSAGTRTQEVTIARHLYGILRDFDALGVQEIYSEAFETPVMGQAIMNRLIKAAGHQILRASEIL